jgi:hypothetical protein
LQTSEKYVVKGTALAEFLIRSEVPTSVGMIVLISGRMPAEASDTS